MRTDPIINVGSSAVQANLTSTVATVMCEKAVQCDVTLSEVLFAASTQARRSLQQTSSRTDTVVFLVERRYESAVLSATNEVPTAMEKLRSALAPYELNGTVVGLAFPTISLVAVSSIFVPSSTGAESPVIDAVQTALQDVQYLHSQVSAAVGVREKISESVAPVINIAWSSPSLPPLVPSTPVPASLPSDSLTSDAQTSANTGVVVAVVAIIVLVLVIGAGISVWRRQRKRPDSSLRVVYESSASASPGPLDENDLLKISESTSADEGPSDGLVAPPPSRSEVHRNVSRAHLVNPDRHPMGITLSWLSQQISDIQEQQASATDGEEHAGGAGGGESARVAMPDYTAPVAALQKSHAAQVHMRNT